MKQATKIKRMLLCVAALLLAGCGGAKFYATIGGTVVNLSPNASVQLLLNGVDTLTVSANGSFAFPNSLQAGDTYYVTINQDPVGQVCTIENGIGAVEQSLGNITGITVNCQVSVAGSNLIVGTVSGLKSGNSVTVVNNGTDSYTVNGTATSATTPITFTFANAIATGSTYSVVVSTSNQSCAVNPASTATGAMPATGTMTPVSIVCN